MRKQQYMYTKEERELLRKRRRNGQRANAKLDEAKAAAIRSKYRAGATLAGLGKVYGVSHETIRRVVQGRSWA